jgi:threonine/homoserine/homoserine lactone efflux protein
MTLLPLLLETLLLSLSGVMAPGPMTAVTVGKGMRSPHAGGMIAVGHAVVEAPLMAAIALGFGRLFELPYVRQGIGLVGGAFLLWMAYGLLRSVRSASLAVREDTRSPLLIGVMLSAANPYFLIWWATVGATMLGRATPYHLLGLVAVGLVHWLCDLGWLYGLSAVAFKGGRSFGAVFQRVVSSVSGAMLLFFGARFVVDSITTLVQAGA